MAGERRCCDLLQTYNKPAGVSLLKPWVTLHARSIAGAYGSFAMLTAIRRASSLVSKISPRFR